MTSHAPGLPVWYEIVTETPEAVEAFYTGVLGWRFSQGPGGPDIDYRVASAAEGMVAGVMRKPPGMPMPEGWLVYFGTDDPDATAARGEAEGGTVHVPGTDIPGVGRFAFLADPQGQLFYVLRMDGEPSGAFRDGQHAPEGHAVWNELTTPDPAGAIAFYGAVLGLRQEGSMPMGALGDYSFIHAGTAAVGAVMGEVPNGRPGWQVYFAVADIDAAAERLGAGGGTAIQGPDAIPGGAYALVAEDPQGARFGMVGPRLG